MPSATRCDVPVSGLPRYLPLPARRSRVISSSKVRGGCHARVGSRTCRTGPGDLDRRHRVHDRRNTRSTPARRPRRARRSSASRRSSTRPTSARSRSRSTTAGRSRCPTGRPSRACRRSPARPGMVIVVPVFELEQPGFYYNTAAVIDADGTLPRQVPQAPHPAGQGLLGEVLLQAGKPRLAGLRHRRRQGRRLHLLRPPLPRGLARARPGRRRSSFTTRPRPAAGCPSYLWQLEQPAAAVANEYFIAAINRVGSRGVRRQRLLRHELLRRPARAVRRRRRPATTTRNWWSATWTST